jgi:hypothetical protein
VIVDEEFHIAHDLGIALMGGRRDGRQFGALLMINGGGLRVQHEGDGQQALDSGQASYNWLIFSRFRLLFHTLIHSIWVGICIALATLDSREMGGGGFFVAYQLISPMRLMRFNIGIVAMSANTRKR